jgi:hypothetical protein
VTASPGGADGRSLYFPLHDLPAQWHAGMGLQKSQ